MQQQIGRFRIVSRLGQGGMGTVYRAFDPALGREVAIKGISGATPDPEAIERFRREARQAAALRHPRIVAVHEFGSAVDPGSGEPMEFLVMDLVEGASLKESLAAGLPREKLLAAVAEIADALGFAHREGIVHRDVKPGNILIDRDGRAFLADFGLARSVKIETARLTATGQVMGTYAYMSPEQARGESDKAGPPTDVYSLGVVLYEGIAGKLPVDKANEFEQLLAIQQDDPPPPTCERELQWIVMKCLEKEPERRYRDGADLAADLRRFAAGDPIAARPASVGYRLRTSIRRKPVVWALAALLVAGAIVGTTLTIVQLRQKLAAQGAARAVDRAVAVLADVEALTYDPDLTHEKLKAGGETLIRIIDESLRANPDSAALHYYYGKARRLLGDDDAADRAFRRAIELDPKDGRPWYERAMILFDRAEARMITARQSQVARTRREALEIFEEASAFLDKAGSREDTELWKLYAGRKYGDVEREASRRIERGGRTETCYRLRAAARGCLKRHVEALEDQRQALDRRPGMWRWWFDLGTIFDELERHEEAAAAYSKALSIRPDDPWSLNNRGGAYASLRRHDRAIEDYDRAIRLNPEFAEAYGSRGVSHGELGRHARAIEDYDRAIALQGDYVEAIHGRGAQLHALARYPEALEAFDLALSLDRENATAYNSRGATYFALGRPLRAIEDYDQAIRWSPEHVRAHCNRGGAYIELHQYDAAIADLDRAIALDGKCAAAFYNRGLAHVRQGDRARALEDFDRAIEIEPDYADAYFSRGTLHGGDRRFEQAVADLDEAIKIKGEYPEALSNRGWICWALGRKDQAERDLQRALELAPADGPLRAEIGDRLNHVRRSQAAPSDF